MAVYILSPHVLGAATLLDEAKDRERTAPALKMVDIVERVIRGGVAWIGKEGKRRGCPSDDLEKSGPPRTPSQPKASRYRPHPIRHQNKGVRARLQAYANTGRVVTTEAILLIDSANRSTLYTDTMYRPLLPRKPDDFALLEHKQRSFQCTEEQIVSSVLKNDLACDVLLSVALGLDKLLDETCIGCGPANRQASPDIVLDFVHLFHQFASRHALDLCETNASAKDCLSS